VEVEAASTVRVRLLARARPQSSTNRLERWLGGSAHQPLPPERTDAVAAWPDGSPWPIATDRLGAQRRRRAIRRLAAGLLLATGIIDVIVAVSPPLRQRLEDALSILPIGVVEGAATITAIAGVVMIMVARGVRRGQHRAWLVAVLTLVVTTATHLLRGGTPLGSLLAIAVLAILVLGRDNFTAATDRTSLETAWPRLLLVALLAVIATTVGVELSNLHRHSLPPWPTVMAAGAERLVGITSIALPDKIADFVDPTMLAVGLSLLVIALYLATRPVVDRRIAEQSATSERRRAEQRARDIVTRHGRGTLDYFALRDDKQFFFHRDSLVAYAVYGGVALLSPDPIGPEGDRSEVFSAFRAFAESRGWTIGVMAAGEAWLSTYAEAGLHSIYLGDEAIVDCPSFTLAGGHMKGLRQACSRLARHGYSVEFHDPARIDPAEVTDVVELIAKLRRGQDERGFSMMLGRLFDPRDDGLLLTIVKGPDGTPAAVCQFVPSPAVGGYSLDLMRRDPGEHPNGLIDYALCSTIAHLAAEGHRGLSLNFAAFRSVLDGERGEGTFTKVERWALRRLSGVLPIETLWSFNAKYQPSWLPRYLVYPAAESFVPVVAAILRAEAITEIPVIGRLLAQDPTNRPGTVVPEEVLEQARHAGARG
jgi:lysyl-tRNA synthetase class 2